MPTTTTSAASTSPPSSSTSSAAPASAVARPAHRAHGNARAQLDPVRPVQRAAVRADLGTEDGLERDGQRLEHGHLATQGGAGRGHLGPDEAGADRRSPAPPRSPSPRPARPAQSSSVRKVKRPSAWPRSSVPGSGRGVAPVVMTIPSPCSSLPSSSVSRARRRVERGGAAAQHLVHAQLARAPLVGQHRLLGRPRPGEDLLGEGRPVVGQMALPAHQRDGPLVALGAQRLDGAPPGQGRADDDDRALGMQLFVRHGLLRSRQNPNIAIHSSAERGLKT